MKQIAILKLGEEFYGLDIMKVSTIRDYEVPNRVPHPKSFVKGVINLRGNIVPILELRDILGYSTENLTDNRKTIIIENDGDLIGLIIDEVLSINNLEDSQIQDLDKVGFNDFADVIESVAKVEDKLVAVLSIDKILKK